MESAASPPPPPPPPHSPLALSLEQTLIFFPEIWCVGRSHRKEVVKYSVVKIGIPIWLPRAVFRHKIHLFGHIFGTGRHRGTKPSSTDRYRKALTFLSPTIFFYVYRNGLHRSFSVNLATTPCKLVTTELCMHTP